jgi:S1-C subfamily serine protease
MTSGHPDSATAHRTGRFSAPLPRTALGLVALLALLAGCTSRRSVASGTPATAPTASPGTGALAIQSAYENVIRGALPSVVQITTGQALGSGIVLDDRGDIVTNAHVVSSATQFQVTYADSTAPHPATLVGTYLPDDLAVIRVQNPGRVHPATFADSSKLQVGQLVLALGNPLGLSSSVTDGIVSAVGRTVTEPQSGDSPGATIPQAIQTSAAINPGNSGGALVDLSGRVVGIPTLAAIDPELNGSAAPGIGFAIPSDLVTDIAGQLVRDGRVTDSHRAALLAKLTTVTDQSGRPVGVGVVSVTPRGPAAAAGIRAGDVIVSVAGHPVGDAQQVAQVLAGQKVGARVPVVITFPGAGRRTVQVTLGELPAS